MTAIALRPAFDPKTSTWFLDDGREAKTLEGLRLKLVNGEYLDGIVRPEHPIIARHRAPVLPNKEWVNWPAHMERQDDVDAAAPKPSQRPAPRKVSTIAMRAPPPPRNPPMTPEARQEAARQRSERTLARLHKKFGDIVPRVKVTRKSSPFSRHSTQVDWDDALIAEVERLRGDGLSYGQIGSIIGVSRNAVIGKMKRIDDDRRARQSAVRAYSGET